MFEITSVQMRQSVFAAAMFGEVLSSLVCVCRNTCVYIIIMSSLVLSSLGMRMSNFSTAVLRRLCVSSLLRNPTKEGLIIIDVLTSLSFSVLELL